MVRITPMHVVCIGFISGTRMDNVEVWLVWDVEGKRWAAPKDQMEEEANKRDKVAFYIVKEIVHSFFPDEMPRDIQIV